MCDRELCPMTLNSKHDLEICIEESACQISRSAVIYFDNVIVQTYKLAYAYKQQTDCSTWSTKMVDK